MDSPQSIVSPFKSSPFAEPEKQKSEFSVRSSGYFSKGTEVQSKEAMVCDLKDPIGVLEVYIHEARDIQNICIYHKQDVYAKICLTSDPENAVSTQTINGGGKNPVFNQNLRLNVRTVDSSLKCEIWMLSRVRNYLEDQLLGFALVPLSEVVMRDGKLEKVFSLSSTDLFHSPAGFVQLTIHYNGASPDVMAIPALPTTMATNAAVQDSELPESVSSDFDNIEFPDPKIANENQMMVSEYYEIQCNNLESQSSESYATSDTENHLSSEIGAQAVESFSTATVESIQKQDSPPTSVSTNGSPSALSHPASSHSACDSPRDLKSPNQEHASPLKEKTAEVGDGETDSSGGTPSNASAKPAVSVKIEPEQKMVQQDIVDMYMKSMQQFTESLAKMKLPLDIENGSPESGKSSTDQKLQASKNSGSRVFYGSRAFF